MRVKHLTLVAVIRMVSRMVVSMAMTMVVPVAMAVAVTVFKTKDTDEIDSQAKRTDDEELRRTTEVRPSKKALNCFVNDFDADKHQEYTISKASQGVDLAITVRKFDAWRPFAHHGCTYTHQQGNAVKEHVYAVADQTEGARQEAVR